MAGRQSNLWLLDPAAVAQCFIVPQAPKRMKPGLEFNGGPPAWLLAAEAKAVSDNGPADGRVSRIHATRPEANSIKVRYANGLRLLMHDARPRWPYTLPE